MDFMIFAQLAVVLLFIYIGARFGSIGIGFAGAAGVLVLTLVFGLSTDASHIPVNVILIIMSVIATVSAMQVAGGMDWMVDKAEQFLRSNPKRITFYAPIVTYLMTLFAGTGHTAFSTLPVIAEVAKGQGTRPSRPLSIAVVASQIAITASPVSAAVVAFAGMLEPFGVSYLTLLAICIPVTFTACMIGAFATQFLGRPLKDDPVYQDRLAKGLIAETKHSKEARTFPPSARLSVIIFGLAIIAVIAYATTLASFNTQLNETKAAVATLTETISAADGVATDAQQATISNLQAQQASIEATVKRLPERDLAIMLFMMTAAALIVAVCKVDTGKILQSSTFKSGMSAAICVLGVAWLGTIFVKNHMGEITAFAETVLKSQPWLLAVALFFASMLLYSQASTTKALMPIALAPAAALVSPGAAIASFAAVSALFVLPTYPTLIAAVEMDDTGSTRIGKYVFNHPFFIPGVVTIFFAVLIGFIVTSIVL